MKLKRISLEQMKSAIWDLGQRLEPREPTQKERFECIADAQLESCQKQHDELQEESDARAELLRRMTEKCEQLQKQARQGLIAERKSIGKWLNLTLDTPGIIVDSHRAPTLRRGIFRVKDIECLLRGEPISEEKK